MSDVRELEIGESQLAAVALGELRPHLSSAGEIAKRVDAQRASGYRLIGSFDERDSHAAGVAGFRVSECLAWDRFLYVDDLVTRRASQGQGHANALLGWLEAEARRQGCTQLHLDSGVGADRADAHRFYFRHGLRITSYHFARALD